MKKKIMYVGIDPSLTGTGIAVIIPENLQGKAGGWEKTISPPVSRESRDAKKKPMTGCERLDYLQSFIESLLESLADKYTLLVCIEDYAFGARHKGHQLGEWGGILRLSLYRQGIGYYTLAPTTLKKYVMGEGKGKGGKKDMISATNRRWGKEFKDDNQSDAYGLARACEAIHSGKIIKCNFFSGKGAIKSDNTPIRKRG